MAIPELVLVHSHGQAVAKAQRRLKKRRKKRENRNMSFNDSGRQQRVVTALTVNKQRWQITTKGCAGEAAAVMQDKTGAETREEGLAEKILDSPTRENAVLL